MRLSLQVQYAICGVFDLAYNGDGEPVQIRVIGERQAIPTRYLEQIFQRLRRAELVTSKRGPGGGYALARPPSQISLRAVVEAIEGPLAESLQMRAEGDAAVASRPDFLWAQLAERIGGELEAVTFEGLCREAARHDVDRARRDGPMWHI